MSMPLQASSRRAAPNTQLGERRYLCARNELSPVLPDDAFEVAPQAGSNQQPSGFEPDAHLHYSRIFAKLLTILERYCLNVGSK